MGLDIRIEKPFSFHCLGRGDQTPPKPIFAPLQNGRLVLYLDLNTLLFNLISNMTMV